MSRYCLVSVMPGWGRQSREETGPQGKTESNAATGSCAFKLNDATGEERHFTERSKILRASKVAPYPAPSSCVPTIGAGAADFGSTLPSITGGNKPSPINSSDTTAESRKKLTTRAFGSPSSI